jgi:hypothetical protein
MGAVVMGVEAEDEVDGASCRRRLCGGEADMTRVYTGCDVRRGRRTARVRGKNMYIARRAIRCRTNGPSIIGSGNLGQVTIHRRRFLGAFELTYVKQDIALASRAVTRYILPL